MPERMRGFDYGRAVVSGMIFILLFVLLYFLIVKIAYAPAYLKGDGPVDPLYPPLRTLDFFLLSGALLASIFGASQYFFLRDQYVSGPSGFVSGAMLGILYLICIIFTIGFLLGFSSFGESSIMDLTFPVMIISLSTIYGYLMGR